MLRTIQSVIALLIAITVVTMLQGAPGPSAPPKPVIDPPPAVEAAATHELIGPATPRTLPVVRVAVTPTPASPRVEFAAHSSAPAPETYASGCPDGGPRASRAQMAAWAAAYDWGPWTPTQIAALFARESGGCVSIVSITEDSGCTQIHFTEERGRRWDFARIRADCAYAIAIANDVYHEREAHGMRGITGWFAGEGFLW